MKYQLNIVVTRRAISKILDTFRGWCISQENIDCYNCPYLKTCDKLHDIWTELMTM